MAERKPLLVGEVLVPQDTPAGPSHARTAWAHALGQLIMCMTSEVDGLVEIPAAVDVGEMERWPAGAFNPYGVTVRADELLQRWERAHG